MSRVASAELRRLLASKVPTTLWHYTSLAGLDGMLTTRCIRATDIRFLNDTEEHRHALVLLEEEASKIEDTINRDMLLESVRAFFSTDVFAQNDAQVFVTSFSAAKDLLSQWRAYTEENRGVALGFDLAPLRPPKKLASLSSLAPCIYDERRKRDLIRSVMRTLLDELNLITQELNKIGTSVAFESWKTPKNLRRNLSQRLEAKREETEGRLNDAIKLAIGDLVRLMPLLKHESFKEEKEWRLSVTVNSSNIPDTFNKRMRIGHASLIPFIDIPFASKTNHETLLTDLIVGPNPAMGRAVAAAKLALNWNGFEAVGVTPSSTTLRSW